MDTTTRRTASLILTGLPRLGITTAAIGVPSTPASADGALEAARCGTTDDDVSASCTIEDDVGEINWGLCY